MKKRKWLLLLSIIAAIGFFIIVYLSIFETTQFEQSITRNPPIPFEEFVRGRPRIPIFNLFISLILLTIAIIPMSYYFISQRFEEKIERKFNVISKLLEKNNSVPNKAPKEIDDKNVILKFLNLSERKVVEKLIERNGDVLQSEISQMEGMTKLKTHRAVRDLERKGIIKRESHGKTNRIILSKDIKEVMLK